MRRETRRPTRFVGASPIDPRLGWGHALRVRLATPGKTATLLASLAAIAVACGSRTGLLSRPLSLRSSLYCARSDYRGGSGNVTVLVLLDRSLSMQDDGKWSAATAAISTFVEDPETAGVAIGLQYLPVGTDDCNPQDYARPAVTVKLLPGNAAAIEASLARTQPDGDTPMLPALQGVMEYARSLLIGDPTRQVAISLITDGQPDTCSSSIQDVAAVAAAGTSADPPVLTFVTALEDDLFAQQLDTVAAAGGSGTAIRVSTPATAAQQLVDSLAALRDTARDCRFAVPPVQASEPPTAQDVTVAVRTNAASPQQPATYVASSGSCPTTDAFFVDDPSKPAWVTLCPALCSRVHADPGTHIDVSVGCGPGAPDGGEDAGEVDAGPCPGLTSLDCQQSCDPSSPSVAPVCVQGNWTCPPGSVDPGLCSVCPPVPHGCCEPDGTIDDASCIDQVWTCPPGATMFGQGNCKPPAVCATLLPCAVGQYCTWPDHSCGGTRTAGTCEPVPANCSPGGGPPACGCDGTTYGSACLGAQAGVDTSTTQSCAAPAGDFACGPDFCSVAGEICAVTSVSLTPQAWSCVAPPAGCSNGCGCNLCPPCPTGKTCTESCTMVSGGGRKLTCNQL